MTNIFKKYYYFHLFNYCYSVQVNSIYFYYWNWFRRRNVKIVQGQLRKGKWNRGIYTRCRKKQVKRG